MAKAPLPLSFERVTAAPLDTSDTFSSIAAFQTYLTGGTAYPGQLCSVKKSGSIEFDVYKINSDMTVSLLEGGGAVDLDQLAMSITNLQDLIG